MAPTPTTRSACGMPMALQKHAALVEAGRGPEGLEVLLVARAPRVVAHEQAAPVDLAVTDAQRPLPRPALLVVLGVGHLRAGRVGQASDAHQLTQPLPEVGDGQLAAQRDVERGVLVARSLGEDEPEGTEAEGGVEAAVEVPGAVRLHRLHGQLGHTRTGQERPAQRGRRQHPADRHHRLRLLPPQGRDALQVDHEAVPVRRVPQDEEEVLLPLRVGFGRRVEPLVGVVQRHLGTGQPTEIPLSAARASMRNSSRALPARMRAASASLRWLVISAAVAWQSGHDVSVCG